MFSKTLFVVAFGIAASVASASSPPGCLLGAVNTYEKPSDIKAICSAKDISKQVSNKCGDKTAEALEALADICNGQGVEVSTKVPTSASGTAAPSGTGAAKSTGTGSGSAASTGAASSSGSSSSGNTENAANASPSSTTSAESPEQSGSGSALELSAAALLAGLGFVVAAL